MPGPERTGRPALPFCACVLFATFVAGGCSLAPTLRLADVPVAENYKEPAPWTTAAPADGLSRDAWWSLYSDPDLDRLQQQLVANSPDLAAALARSAR